MLRRRPLLVSAAFALLWTTLRPSRAHSAPQVKRVRPGDTDWPSAEEWVALRDRVDGHLVALEFAAQFVRSGDNSGSMRATLQGS